ncbi:MAG TPA: hypothetical protein VJ752_04870 [Burkholderiaceae bacterium]|nr:hypothetical protein [Burkholderiaceae bacterium]
MTSLKTLLRQPAVRQYLLGHAAIVLGAWLMDLTQSMLPMALAASAALMLSLPLLRQLSSRFRRNR